MQPSILTKKTVLGCVCDNYIAEKDLIGLLKLMNKLPFYSTWFGYKFYEFVLHRAVVKELKL